MLLFIFFFFIVENSMDFFFFGSTIPVQTFVINYDCWSVRLENKNERNEHVVVHMM